jgi:hypothetical protein
MRHAKLLATVVSIASATSACGTSGAATKPDASPITAGADAAVTSFLDASHASTGGAGEDSSLPLPAGVLVSGQHTPIGIALDDDNVYWMNLGTYSEPLDTYSGAQLMKCAKTGCGNAPTELASGPWNGTTRLAVGNGSIYWATRNLLLRCATTGCTSGPTILWAGSLAPTDVAVGATTIYFGNSQNDELLTCPVGGCPTNPTVLFSSSVAPAAIALDGTTVYFGAAGISILSCEPSGCGPIVVGGTPTAIDVNGSNVYVGTVAVVSRGALAYCPKVGCSAGLTLLTSNLSYCAGIAADATDVYFTDLGTTEAEAGPVPSGAGRVAKCAIAGCNGDPTPLAGFVNFPQQIAVDATRVYWTDFGSSTDPHASDDGRVMAIAK